jgi:hypothetical protein
VLFATAADFVMAFEPAVAAISFVAVPVIFRGFNFPYNRLDCYLGDFPYNRLDCYLGDFPYNRLDC